ncbi:MAG: class I SAM-dependent methyltransferase [Candidatus Thorarchaeota archaeon]|jgi:SAM-dependent methyltransferase
MSSFDDVALAYDEAINWDRRLAREIPFIVSRVGEIKGKRVLDLACGSGRHAAALAQQGAEVVGIDSSESMLSRAKEHASSIGVTPKFIRGDMSKFNSLTTDQFDLVICLGNSLALLDSFSVVETVVFSRFYDHTDPPNSSTLVMTAQIKKDGEWNSLVSTQKVLNLNSDVMIRYLAQAGFQETRFYSNYSESLFVGSDDRNMVIHSRR